MADFYMFFACEANEGRIEYAAEKAITNRSFKVSRVTNLNDPFEFQFAEVVEPELNDALKLMIEDLSKQIGILCFSRSWKHPLMWSHYASEHQSICLGFEYSGPSDAPVDVTYCNERLVVSEDALHRIQLAEVSRKHIACYGKNSESLKAIADGQHAENEFLKLFGQLAARKHRDWEYEQEVRLSLRGDRDFVNWSEDFVLTEVLLGARCQADPHDVMGWCNEQRTPQLYRVFLMPRQYALDRRPIQL